MSQKVSEKEKLPKGIRVVQPSGKYQARYMGPDGKRHSVGTFSNLDHAKRALARAEIAIEDGNWKTLVQVQDGGLDPRTATLRQLSEQWVESRLNREGRELAPKTKQEYRRMIDGPLAVFADKPIRQITPAQVKKWHTGYKTEKGRARNAAYKYLKSLLDWAEAERLIMESPCQIKSATRWSQSGLTPLPTRTELAIMLETAESDEARALIALCAYCGLRVGEACGLRGEDISTVERGEETWWVVNVNQAVNWLKGGKWEIGPPKSEEGFRRLPIPEKALPYVLKLLESRPRDPQALLFSRDSEGTIAWGQHTYRAAFKKPRAVSGFKGSIKDLRSYHLTSYSIAGANLRETMKRGGHKSPQAAMRYQKLAEGRSFEIVGRLS